MTRTIVCKDCGQEFEFTEEEQAFYKEKEFNDPVRCRSCRKIKKQKFNSRGGNNEKSFHSYNNSQGI